jgi:hypothetical protein
MSWRLCWRNGRRFGIRAEIRSRGRFLRPVELSLQGLQLGPESGLALVRHLAQIILEDSSPPLPPVGFESSADLIDAAGKDQIQVVEVEIRGLAHGLARYD